MSSDQIAILKSSKGLSVELVAALPFNRVERAWNGELLSKPFAWVVVADPTMLWFAAELPAAALPAVAPPKKHSQGEFVEWLAEGDDVVELFVMSQDKTYQEWHISPDGAWWSMGFVGYRTREPSPEIPSGISVEVVKRAGSWLGVLGIPLGALRVGVDQIALMQVTGCVNDGGSPLYISTAGNPPYAPDFHDLRSFRPVALEAI